MIVSDYIVNYIKEKGTKFVFGYPGGMVTYLMDSFDEIEGIKGMLLYHEQAAAFAACSYAQESHKLGVAYATSGPGATNLVTGIAHAFYESIPVLFITGQVNTNDSKGDLLIRQKGFQETDVVSITKSITKFSEYIGNPELIKYYLDKAYYYALSGRPGPVLLDIPIDVQRAEINPLELVGFKDVEEKKFNYGEILDCFFNELSSSKKPVIILGNGINISNVKFDLLKALKKLNIPVVTSMISVDLLEYDNNINYGFIGAYGHRYSNFIISKSDLVISLGSRLDIRQTGSNISEFAKNAKILRFDIDENEFSNVISQNTINCSIDLRDFVKLLINDSRTKEYSVKKSWIEECDYLRNKLKGYDNQFPNNMIERISEYIPNNHVITTDVGQNQVWVAQSFNVKKKQRILFSGGHGSMGYSLPAAIGAFYSSQKTVFCFVGDGGMQMNIQELQVIKREKLPIKIFVINNNSLGMIRHFQEMYFNSNFSHTVENKGYSAPDFVKIANAYGIRSYRVENLSDIDNFKNQLSDNQPLLLDIIVGKTTFVYPKLEFTKPIYDQDPPLDRKFLEELLKYGKGNE